MSKVMCAIGLMSGTSMDGIDVARIETDGDRILRRFPAITYPYSVDFRARLIEALDIAQTLRGRTARPGALAEIEAVLTTHHADAVTTYLRDSAPMEGPAAVDLIGFHGQTILHRPAERLTVQLGDGPKLATMTGIPVIYDLRAADVAAGGQGAPLACIYHRAMASHVPDRPVAVLNIGGVANVTWVGPGNDLIGFDTGPGNAMIDDWVQSKAGAMRDEDGAFAAQGRISDDIIRTYLEGPYFDQPPPKSLDRNAFPLARVSGLSLEDGAATLTALTVATIARSVDHMPAAPVAWIVCGGGRHNRTMMRLLAAQLPGKVMPAEALGYDGDSIEAEAWAYLAVRSKLGLPISFPKTTGVPRPMSGGIMARP